MSEKRPNPVLQDHVAVKRKLAPRFASRLGNRISPYSWTRQLVPEAIWIALIIDHCGYLDARRICLDLLNITRKIWESDNNSRFANFSTFLMLNDEQKRHIKSNIDNSNRFKIVDSLNPLFSIISTHPLDFLSSEYEYDNPDKDRLSKVLKDVYDRNGRLAVLSMALTYYIGIEQDRIRISPHMVDDFVEKFKHIPNYPDSEEARDAAGAFRAAAPMLFMSYKDDGSNFESDEPWVNEFWDAVSGFGPCSFLDTLEDEPLESDESIERFIVSYRNRVRSDLRERLARWPLNLNEIETYEVISSLLCRQATITIELASSPGIWTPHTAPIILRSMADVFISLAWILKDPTARCKKYIEDGLGAIKLQIAHQERALEDATDPADIDDLRTMIDAWREWLSMQRLHIFVEVNLGNWSGLNTRKMAEESGFIDFYNYVYQPFSGAVHSNWPHISTLNAVHCQNPAHRGHRAPAIVNTPPDLHWLFLATKYLSKTLAHFDDVNGLVGIPQSAFDFFTEQVEVDQSEPGENDI